MPSVKYDHDNSTDTDDSDDSEVSFFKRQIGLTKIGMFKEEEAAVSVDSDGSAPVPEDESQPTPPPRKKKLKKKLEQLVEQKLNLTEEDIKLEVKEHNKESDVKPLRVQGEVSDMKEGLVSERTNDTTEEESSAVLGAGENTESPKKTRRRKKHVMQ